MKKILFVVILLSACSPLKTIKKGKVIYIYNPKEWVIEDLTKEDSLKLDSLIKLNQ